MEESKVTEMESDVQSFERVTKRNRLTRREWLAFRIQSRQNEAHTILRSRRISKKNWWMGLP